MGLKEDLLANIKNLRNSADAVYERFDFTSAFILYFKCLLAICDYALLLNGKGVPKDHSERFRLLEKNFPDAYNEVDFLFKHYQKSYSMHVRKEICDEAKASVRVFADKFKIVVPS